MEDMSKTPNNAGQPDGSFAMQMDNTTYVIGVHFSRNGRETLEDKMKRLIQQDVKEGKF